MDGADLCTAGFAEVIHGGLDVFGGRAERDKRNIGVVVAVFGDGTVVASGEIAEIVPCGLEHSEDGLGEVVAASDDAIHVVLLILDRSDQGRVGEINDLGDTATGRAEEDLLGLGRAFDDVVGRTEEFAEQFGFVLEEGALEVGGKKTILDVHARGERLLGHAAQHERLVGGLLSVFGEEHDPAGIECGIDVVVATVDIKGVFGESAGADLEHHGAEFAGSVVVLLDAVNDALAGGEVDGAFAGDRGGDGTALGGVLTLGFDGEGGAAKDIELSFGAGEFEHFAHLGGRSDGIINPGLGNACFGVGSHELITVGGDPDTRIFWLLSDHDMGG